MSKVSAKVLEFAFDFAKLHRVQVFHFEENKASKRIIEKLKFVKVGIVRENYYKNDKWLNSVMYSLLSTEYQKNKLKLFQF